MLENLISDKRLSLTNRLEKEPGNATGMNKVTKQFSSPLTNDIFKLEKN